MNTSRQNFEIALARSDIEKQFRLHPHIEGDLIRNNAPKQKSPTTLGEILREEFLKPFGITQRQLAKHLGCGVNTIHRIINGRSQLTAQLAVKLGAAFNTSPEFWMNAQQALDLHTAKRKLQKLPPKLRS